MASHPSMAPTLVISPPQTRIDIASSTSGTSISKTHVSSSSNGIAKFSNEMEANGEQQTVSSPAQRGPRVTFSAFGLGDSNSSLPNSLGVEIVAIQ
jgi:hypothetical protein